MKRIVVTAMMLLCVCVSTSAQAMYEPNWESLDARPIPQWYDEAKFGIFIHWGVYSVPAWGPETAYAEWYWYDLMKTGSPTGEFHNKTYGRDFKYQDFAPMFKAEMYDPDEWADLFARAGAKYVVLTSKHHEGFCLWPSRYSWNWNAWDVGPHRDLAGDLTKAVRDKGLKMGFYYSLYEWFHPFYPYKEDVFQKYSKSDHKKNPMRSASPEDINYYVDTHMFPQLKELVTRYKPSILWTDGEWDYPSDVWRATEFLAWLFNESPVRGEIVINDRWGSETRSRHGGFYTSEYGHTTGKGDQVGPEHKWEENRGIGRSFGYNRNENIDNYESSTALIHLLIDTVARGGNLLLDVGPTADGRIPVIMQQRLLDIGGWLRVNGGAIYGTHPWRIAGEGENIRYTAKGGAVYVIVKTWPGKELSLTEIKPAKNSSVKMLGMDGNHAWIMKNGKMTIAVPQLSIDEIPCGHAYVFEITGLE